MLILAAFLVMMVALFLGLVELRVLYCRRTRARSWFFPSEPNSSATPNASRSCTTIRGTTDSAYRIQYDAPSLKWIVADSLPSLTTAVVTLFGMVYVTFRIDWQLGLVALAVSPSSS